MVWTWVKCLYANRLKEKILAGKDKRTEDETIQLLTIGKYALVAPRSMKKGEVGQAMVDLYWSWVWDEEVAGKRPEIGPHFPMILSEMCVRFGRAHKDGRYGWWAEVSTLEPRDRVVIPLQVPPALELVDGQHLAKTVAIRRRRGRWHFQITDRSPDPVFDGSAGKMAVDVGRHVLAATSDGRLYGLQTGPRFVRLWRRTQDLRSNRYRQGLKEDSPRLARLEERLTGMVRTMPIRLSPKGRP
jgi:hypothetical protein